MGYNLSYRSGLGIWRSHRFGMILAILLIANKAKCILYDTVAPFSLFFDRTSVRFVKHRLVRRKKPKLIRILILNCTLQLCFYYHHSGTHDPFLRVEAKK